MKQNWIQKYKQPDPRGIEPPTGNRIGNLDDSIPFTTDPISQGDDHIRATKRALQGTFPVIGDEPVTITPVQWNHTYARVSVGIMMYFDDRLAPIPIGWAPCDGNEYNGYQTFDLRGYFIKASGIEGEVGAIGGENVTFPEVGQHAITESEMPSHNHTGTPPYGRGGADEIGAGDNEGWSVSDTNQNLVSSSAYGNEGVADSHSHGIAGHDNQPEYITFQMIVYVGIN